MTEQNSSPSVSVVLCAFQASRTIAAAIQSIVEQSFGDWELIVIDDGSTDGTGGIARQFDDDRIVVLSDGRNLGLPERLNQGVSVARGEFIARMDADDVCFPERLAMQVAYLRRNTGVDLVASSTLVFGADGKATGILPVETQHSRICAKPWHGFAMPHPTWMGRRTWFRNNPYDVDARQAEDQNLLYVTHLRSTFACVPEALLAYRYERLSLSRTLVGRLHFVKGIAKGGNLVHLVRAAITHTCAALRDVAAILFSMDDRVIRGRLSPAPAEVASRWDDLRRRLPANGD